VKFFLFLTSVLLLWEGDLPSRYGEAAFLLVSLTSVFLVAAQINQYDDHSYSKSHNRSMFLIWCGFRHLQNILNLMTPPGVGRISMAEPPYSVIFF
jgi:hypothetical protein